MIGGKAFQTLPTTRGCTATASDRTTKMKRLVDTLPGPNTLSGFKPDHFGPFVMYTSQVATDACGTLWVLNRHGVWFPCDEDATQAQTCEFLERAMGPLA